MPILGHARRSAVLLALAICAAPVALLAPIAAATRIPVSGKHGAVAYTYVGTDRYGAVTFSYYAPARSKAAMIYTFEFANRCNRKGSRVTVGFAGATTTT